MWFREEKQNRLEIEGGKKDFFLVLTFIAAMIIVYGLDHLGCYWFCSGYSIVSSLGWAGTTPSVPNYKAFQESWRVKHFKV